MTDDRADEASQEPTPRAGLDELDWLVGTWWGFGVGGYPTIESFRFEQEITFGKDERGFLKYDSQSWVIDDEGERVRPGQSESGWWRAGANPRELEVLLAHHSGIVEVYVGEWAFSKIELATDLVARTATAKEVGGVKRLYGKVEDDLAYAIDMAAVGQPLQSHVSARLQKIR